MEEYEQLLEEAGGVSNLRRAAVELTDATGLGRVKVLLQGKDVPATPLTGLTNSRADGPGTEEGAPQRVS